MAFENSTGLYIEPLRRSGPRRLLTRNVRGFVWSPDSKKLLVAVSGGSRLAVVDRRACTDGIDRGEELFFLPHLTTQVMPLG